MSLYSERRYRLVPRLKSRSEPIGAYERKEKSQSILLVIAP